MSNKCEETEKDSNQKKLNCRESRNKEFLNSMGEGASSKADNIGFCDITDTDISKISSKMKEVLDNCFKDKSEIKINKNIFEDLVSQTFEGYFNQHDHLSHISETKELREKCKDLQAEEIKLNRMKYALKKQVDDAKHIVKKLIDEKVAIKAGLQQRRKLTPSKKKIRSVGLQVCTVGQMTVGNRPYVVLATKNTPSSTELDQERSANVHKYELRSLLTNKGSNLNKGETSSVGRPKPGVERSNSLGRSNPDYNRGKDKTLANLNVGRRTSARSKSANRSTTSSDKSTVAIRNTPGIKSTPVRGIPGAKSAPVKSTPVKSNVKSTPAKSNVKSTPAKSNVKSTPVKSNVKSTAVKSNVKNMPGVRNNTVGLKSTPTPKSAAPTYRSTSTRITPSTGRITYTSRKARSTEDIEMNTPIVEKKKKIDDVLLKHKDKVIKNVKDSKLPAKADKDILLLSKIMPNRKLSTEMAMENKTKERYIEIKDFFLKEEIIIIDDDPLEEIVKDGLSEEDLSEEDLSEEEIINVKEENIDDDCTEKNHVYTSCTNSDKHEEVYMMSNKESCPEPDSKPGLSKGVGPLKLRIRSPEYINQHFSKKTETSPSPLSSPSTSLRHPSSNLISSPSTSFKSSCTLSNSPSTSFSHPSNLLLSSPSTSFRSPILPPSSPSTSFRSPILPPSSPSTSFRSPSIPPSTPSTSFRSPILPPSSPSTSFRSPILPPSTPSTSFRSPSIPPSTPSTSFKNPSSILLSSPSTSFSSPPAPQSSGTSFCSLPKYPPSPRYPANIPKPPAPILQVGQKTDFGTRGIMLTWSFTCNQKPENIVEYQLFAHQESGVGEKSVENIWRKVGDIKALPLPMACFLSQFLEGKKYHFIIRAVDTQNRIGDFSIPAGIILHQLENSDRSKLPTPNILHDSTR